MDFLNQIQTGNLSYASMVILVVLGIFTLYVAYKVGRFVLKVLCILAGATVIVAAVCWLILKHS